MEYFPDGNFETQNTEPMNETNYSSHEENSNTSQYNTENQNTGDPSNRPFPNVFAFFARSLGIFSIFCAIFGIFFGTFICGGLAIVLAILSKGYHTKMERSAVIALATGIIAIVIQISTLTINVYNIINVPEYRELFNSMYEQMYGEPVDESITEMLDQMELPSEEGGIL